MKIAKAIEILELNAREAGKQMPPDVRLALLLGIQALIRHRDKSTFTYAGMIMPLPGETPEGDPP